MRRIFALAAAGLALAACGKPKDAQRGDAVAPAQMQAGAAAGACQGFDPTLPAFDNAKRFQARPDHADEGDARAKEIAATIAALPSFAPVYPCATALSADSPPDETGSLQIGFSVADKPDAVQDFYKHTFEGNGAVATNAESRGEETVLSVNVTSADGKRYVEVFIQSAAGAATALVFIRVENSAG